jgi:uncharacterized membrane protein
MTVRRLAAINAILFFIFWLFVLLAGADKPPPRDFLWIALTIAICAVVVYWRVPTYVTWRQTKRPGRYGRVALDGILAGLLVAVPFALLGSGEPSVTMQPGDYAIWFAVLALMGLLNTVVLYLINAVVVSNAPSLK